jgi:hypothetical protein
VKAPVRGRDRVLGTHRLVDLSGDAEVLLPPQAYPDVALPEDRLFGRQR